MNKITTKMYNAIVNKQNFELDNTTVHYDEDVNNLSIFLFGNKIAQYVGKEQKLILDTCGWDTPTTARRLNAICNAFGLDISVSIKKQCLGFNLSKQLRQETNKLILHKVQY